MIILGTNSIKDTGFDVANSCRFNSASNDHLNRTQTAGNRRKFTFSTWVKRCNPATRMALFLANRSGSNYDQFFLHEDGILEADFYHSGTQIFRYKTNALYRDSSAWYNIIMAVDTEHDTASSRVRIYVNGLEVTSFSTETNPSENVDTHVNENSIVAYIGSDYNSNEPDYYLAETVMLDGTQATPTDFGEFDEDSGIWKPIDITGLTYASYSFLLDFEDSSNLGNNASGSGLADLTEAGLAATDQSTDTCTNNFATLNPLNSSSNDSHTPPTYSEGNLQSASPSSGGGYVGSSTIGVTNGKWFWEFKKSGGSATNIYNGIGNEVGTAEIARQSAVGVYFGNQVFYRPDGTKQIITNGSNANSSYGASWTTNDIIGIALDLDSSTNTVTFYKNGASQGAINLPVNTDTWFFIVACGTDTVDTWQLNFGSPPYAISSGNTDGNGYGNFEYSVPSGYYSLNTKNLAEHG